MIHPNFFDNDIDYLLQEKSIKITDILENKDNSLEWLKSKTHKIDAKARVVLNYFFEKNNIKTDSIPQYYVSPYWGEASGNYKFRYMIINDNDTYILVCFRIIGIMYNSMYFCISYKPLSNNSGYCTKKVLKLLSNIDCVKKIEVFVPQSTKWDLANFYCTEECLYNTSKNMRKQKKKAFQLLNEGIKIETITCVDKNIIEKLNELFDTFELLRFKFNRRATIKMAELVANQGMFFVWWLNSKIIGFQIISNDYLNIASIHSAKDITTFPVEKICENYTNGDFALAKKIKSFLGTLQEEFVKNFIFKCKKYDALYVYGTRDDKGKYLEHKRKHYGKCVYSAIVNLDDYIKNL